MSVTETNPPQLTRQARKHSIGMAGEFLVAGELLRRGVMAAVTYGHAKKADVLVVHDGRAVTLEVKTTSELKWVLGGVVPEDSGHLWVLVYLPPDPSLSPEYFVLKGSELHAILWPQHLAYLDRFLAKHGKAFEGKGVVSIHRQQLGQAGQWFKILDELGADAPRASA